VLLGKKETKDWFFLKPAAIKNSKGLFFFPASDGIKTASTSQTLD